MDLVGVVMSRDVVAEPVDLRLVRHIGEMCRDAQPLRHARRLAKPLRLGHPSAETSHIATLQASATTWRTSSRPIPEPPPVTTAILPANSFMLRSPWGSAPSCAKLAVPTVR